VYLVISGDTVFDKKTSVYTGFVSGLQQGFNAADAKLWPPADQANLVATQDVTITASFFEDDSGDISAIASVLDAAVNLVFDILGAAGKPAPADLQKGITDFIDAVAAALPLSQLLGADTMVVKTNGQKTNLNGQAKSSFDVKKTTQGAGGPY